MSTFTLSSTVRHYPHAEYAAIKRAIVGNTYHVTLTFVGAVRARRLNEQYRKKTYVPNVLSFPLDTHTGEIFICPHVAQREAADFGLSYKGYITYLFIHGLLHLKGYDHGATMERLEERYRRQFLVR